MWTVQHRLYSEATETMSPRGVRQTTWGAWHDREVYGWAPPTTREARSEGTVVQDVDLEIYAPTFPVDHRDQFRVLGKTYDVEGDPGDYDHGPFGYTPGMVVRLSRGD